MKLLVFAHTPPPFHGQSYMVQLMIEGFGGDVRKKNPNSSEESPIEVYHVNARFSDGMDDIGGIRPGKLFKLFRYCFEAIWNRLRHGVRVFYYVPAPPKRSALYRDWLVMLICRPFFSKIIFHWHAMGLGEWLEKKPDEGGPKIWERWLTKKLLSGVDLSIVLTDIGREDCAVLQPKRIAIVPNGIVDPCPDFTREIEVQRRERFSGTTASDAQSPRFFHVLYMAHCIREKGLFDALEAIVLVNERLEKENPAWRFHLTVAGEFMNPEERREFDKRIESQDLFHNAQPMVHYAGFVSGQAKNELLRSSDCLCFPTYYSGEAFPVLLIEALAWGLGIVSTQWRAIPKILPPSFPLVPPKNPPLLAEALLESLRSPRYREARSLFLSRYTDRHYQQGLADSINQL